MPRAREACAPARAVMLSPRRALLIAVVYAGALAYLSLIPFELKPISLEEGWRRFAAIPFLSLGVMDRADWIANLVAYVPLGFFLAAALHRRGLRPAAVSVVTAVAIAAAFATAIEFCQVFFAPRTVSLNDLLAEVLGASAGALAWVALGDRLDEWTRALVTGGARSVRAVLWAYAVCYLLVGLFPYDFVTTAQELAWKLASGNHGLLFVPGQCSALLACSLKVAAEVLAAAPLGWLVASYAPGPGPRAGRAFAAGACLGVLLEGAQLLLASGRSQGVSVLTRAAGVALGAVAKRAVDRIGLEAAVRWGRILSVVGTPPYLFVLAFASGWVGATPLGIKSALGRLPEFNYLPFYYHYFVPEAHAVASAIVHVALYAPVGAAAWLWLRMHRAGAALGTLAACALATAVELGKIFLPGKHPDFTDVLIAGISAWAVFKALELATRLEVKIPITPARAAEPSPRSASTTFPERPVRAGRLARGAGAAALGAIIVWSVLDFPTLRLPLAATLLVYAAVLAWHPLAWLVLLPASLPVLDLAPWTGRLFWDELDLFVLATLAVRLVGRETIGPPRAPGISTRTPVVVVVACALASAMIGVLPLHPLDANAFASYYSHYNALRTGKGVLWACALFFLMRRDAIAGVDVLGLFAKGMIAGLGTAALAVLWERATFTGLFDAVAGYRVTGLSSSMHVGGASLESFLLAALPFALHAAIFSRSLPARIGAAGLAGIGCYALAVTFSRSGYVAFGVEVVVLAGLLLVTRRRMSAGPRRLAVGIALGTAALVIVSLVVPVAMGPYASARFAGIARDAPERLNQWQEAVHLFEPRPAALIFGMGLGRFPERYLWGGPAEARPATYQFGIEGGNTYLRLGAGQALYFDQFVGVAPRSTYVLSLDARRSEPDAALSVALCEKLILYSRRCVWLALPQGRPDARDWEHHRVRLDTRDVGDGTWPLRPPVKISLTHSGTAGRVDVDNVSLVGADGAELVANGDFSAGGDRWLFTANDFWPWHVENLFLHTFFEQGIAGLLALLALLAIAVGRSLSAPRTDGLHAAYLASIAGLIAMGMLNTVINAPRLALVFYLVLFSALLIPLGPNRHRG